MEVFVEHFDKVVYRFQVAQVVVANVDADAEVQARVPPVDDLEVTELHEVRVFGVPDSDDRVHLFDQLLFLVVVEVHVPLRQSRLAGPVLYQYEADHRDAFGSAKRNGTRCKSSDKHNGTRVS